MKIPICAKRIKNKKKWKYSDKKTELLHNYLFLNKNSFRSSENSLLAMLVFVTYSVRIVSLFDSLVEWLPVADEKWHPLFIQQGQSFGCIITGSYIITMPLRGNIVQL